MNNNNLKTLNQKLNALNSNSYTLNEKYHGQIFKIETKTGTTKKGAPYQQWYFFVQDQSGAIILNATVWNLHNQHNIPTINFCNNLQVGDQVSFSGQAKKDHFSKLQDWNIDVNTNWKLDLVKTGHQPLMTQQPLSSEQVPHVEFLAKSKFSNHDGLMSPSDLITANLQLGRNVVALTDWQTSQGFPELQNAIEAHNAKYPQEQIKPLYGVTLNIVEEQIPCTLNTTNLDWRQIENYVVFDLETTGLSTNFNDIIEIGAAKFENDQVVTFQTFVKPNQPIPTRISELTGITNEMVANAPDLKTALSDFLNFVGQDKILAGHNILKFDRRFINAAINKTGLASNFGQLPLVDTMQFSRALLEQKFHNLKKFCTKMNVAYDDQVAHRADVDAKVNLLAWEQMLKKPEFNWDQIQHFNDLNNHLQTPLLSKQTKYLPARTFYLKNQSALAEFNYLISRSLTVDYIDSAGHRIKTDSLAEVPAIQDHRILQTNGVHWEDELFDAANNEDLNILNQMISQYDFISLTPLSNFSLEVAKQVTTWDNLKQIYKTIIRLAQQQNKLVIVVSEASYANAQQKPIYDLLTQIPLVGHQQHRLYWKNADPMNPNAIPDLSLKNGDWLMNDFQWLAAEFGWDFVKQICSTNTLVLANQFEFVKPMKRQLYSPTIANCKTLLTEQVWTNAKKQYGDPLPPLVEQRLKRELKAILEHNFEVVYWVSAQLVAKSNADGYLVGSRGSVGSSLVATMLNITEINPLAPHYYCNQPQCHYFQLANDPKIDSGYDLSPLQCPKCGHQLMQEGQNIPFETFLGFNGDKVPDIDLNFAGEYQSKAHEFLKQTLGEQQVFRAGTISTMATKTAFNEVEKYFLKSNQRQNINAGQIEFVAQNLLDIKRTTGQHPGGIIVVPQEMSILDFSPINFPADDFKAPWYTTHYEFSHLHENLLKFDILGHDDPTLLYHLEKLTGIKPTTIPLNDPVIRQEVLAQFNPYGFGLSEFGTQFARDAVLTTKPQTFADLVALSGLLHGTNVYEGNIKDLILNDKKTLAQVPSCRDDIMLDLIKANIDPQSAFTIMEQVRKGQGLQADQVQQLQTHNVPDWYIRALQKISYMFPKAHAAAYVLSAYRIAYFKKYHPAAFYATWLSYKKNELDWPTIQQGQPAIQKMIKYLKDTKNLSTKEQNSLPALEVINEALDRGVAIEPINLDQSAALTFVPDLTTNHLIPPLIALNGIGQNLAQKIVTERQKQRFSDFHDFKSRTKINKSQSWILCTQDAFPPEWKATFFWDYFISGLTKTTLKQLLDPANPDFNSLLNQQVQNCQAAILKNANGALYDQFVQAITNQVIQERLIVTPVKISNKSI